MTAKRLLSGKINNRYGYRLFMRLRMRSRREAIPKRKDYDSSYIHTILARASREEEKGAPFFALISYYAFFSNNCQARPDQCSHLEIQTLISNSSSCAFAPRRERWEKSDRMNVRSLSSAKFL